MESREFYQSLSSVGTRVSWSLNGDNVLTGVGRLGNIKGVELNPITALATKRGLGSFGNGKRDTVKAGKALGLTSEFINHVYGAINGATNRGNTQVVRGKIRSALGV